MNPQQQQQRLQMQQQNSIPMPGLPVPNMQGMQIETFVPESKLFTQLQDFEKRLDQTILRKRLDIQEALSKPMKTQRFLRIFLSNLASDQYVEEGGQEDNNMDADNIKCPSWTLRIEGRLLEPTVGNKKGAVQKQFSHFIKSVYVELQRDAGLYPDGNMIEWHKQPGSADCDGFEIKRKGDTNTPVKIFIQLEHQPEKFKLSAELSRVLDIHTDTKSNCIMALWQYIKLNKLQDPDDRRYINCDDTLKRVFNVQRFLFTQIPELLNMHILPPDPVVLEYIIKVDKEYHIGQYAYDVEVEVDDPMKAKMTGLLNDIPGLNKELSNYDEKIIGIIQAINQCKLKRDFFLSFSNDPCGFIKQWMASQNRDMEIILGDVRIDAEDARNAKFFDQPW
ncbi:SWI SNF, matrix associated, actin dependent regulator of chromatin, sub d, member 3, partial [Clydaea vesicula]